MARSRGSTQFRGRSSSRRKTGWEEGPFSGVVALSAVGATLWGVGQQALFDGLTIARIRGEALLWINSGGVLAGFQSYGIGLCVVTASAFTFGVTAVPSPLTEIEWEGWMFHHVGAAIVQPGATAGEHLGSVGAVRIPIDTKAMRKIGSDEVLCGVVEMGTEVGAATAQFSAQTRQLLMLP